MNSNRNYPSKGSDYPKEARLSRFVMSADQGILLIIVHNWRMQLYLVYIMHVFFAFARPFKYFSCGKVSIVFAVFSLNIYPIYFAPAIGLCFQFPCCISIAYLIE